jgi:hypothetical protein
MRYLGPCLLLVLFTMQGCGGRPFTVTVPPDWKAVDETRSFVIYSKQGKPLQMIVARVQPLDKELNFTKKRFTKGMLPHEAAEIVADTVRANPELAQQEILENAPATIAGHQGFKVTYRYQTPEGLRKQAVQYGFLTDDRLYLLAYEAPTRYYYATDLPIFERVKESFQLKSSQ